MLCKPSPLQNTLPMWPHWHLVSRLPGSSSSSSSSSSQWEVLKFRKFKYCPQGYRSTEWKHTFQTPQCNSKSISPSLWGWMTSSFGWFHMEHNTVYIITWAIFSDHAVLPTRSSISPLFSVCRKQDTVDSAHIEIPFSIFHVDGIDHPICSVVPGTVGDIKINEPWPRTLGTCILMAKGWAWQGLRINVYNMRQNKSPSLGYNPW